MQLDNYWFKILTSFNAPAFAEASAGTAFDFCAISPFLGYSGQIFTERAANLSYSNLT
jgi:hypothetical protein